MARLPRFILPGQPQDVIQRDNNRVPTFIADDDYQFYREKLLAACEKHQCDICAYVFMTNHVHLLITLHTESGISKVMQMLGRYYVQYFNHTYPRTGTLWEGPIQSNINRFRTQGVKFCSKAYKEYGVLQDLTPLCDPVVCDVERHLRSTRNWRTQLMIS